MSQIMVEFKWDKTDTMTATIIGGEKWPGKLFTHNINLNLN